MVRRSTMRGRVGSSLCALALVAPTLATPVAAQLATGHAGQSSGPRAGTEDEFWFALRDMGACLAKTKPAQSRALLATRLGTVDEVTATKALMGETTYCLRQASRMRLPTTQLRGIIAEWLYEHPVKGPLSQIASPRPAVIDPSGGRDAPYAFLADFSRCFAEAYPGQVHALLADTNPGTKKEQVAVDALKAEFATCLPPRVAMDFNASQTRAALAEAVFRRSAISRPPVGQR